MENLYDLSLKQLGLARSCVRYMETIQWILERFPDLQTPELEQAVQNLDKAYLRRFKNKYQDWLINPKLKEIKNDR